MIRPIDKVIVHCSDSPDDRTSVDVHEIRRWHLERGFKDVGYHFVIKKDGQIQSGRVLNYIGAHCKGENIFSVGICWVGRHDCNRQQYMSLIKCIEKVLVMYKLGVDAVFGHSDFDPHKTCPNIPIPQLRDDILKFQKGAHVFDS